MLSALLILALVSGFTLISYAAGEAIEADHTHVYQNVGDEEIYESVSGTQHSYTDSNGNIQVCQTVIFKCRQYFHCLYCGDDGYNYYNREVHYGCGQ